MIPIVMSGGSGTRLWPVSRSQFPKQFCELFEESLQLKTLRRLQPLNSPWTLTTSSLRVLTERTLKEAELPLDQVIYEPFGCNTAPAIALTCLVFSKKNMSDEVIGIFPADHLVQDGESFRQAVRLAEACAQKDQVVTLGIQPDYPATGYGYIETKSDEFERTAEHKALWAERFCEKPDLKTAEQFLKAGRFYWNAGMFVFKVQVMIDHFKKHLPQMWASIELIKEDLSNVAEVYKTLEKISIDYGIMERLEKLVCIHVDIGWSDVGSWEEIAKVDESKVDSIEIESSNNYICSKLEGEKVYSFVGVEDLLVVDTADALMIARKGQSQEVKKVVEELKSLGKTQSGEHVFTYRPWGKYEILRDTDQFKSKVITVDPGERLSYQSHEQREEHWVVVAGDGELTLNDEVKKVSRGDYIFIPLQAKHRIACTGNEKLIFVEVQIGDYFGEDDITRYQDDYQR